MTDQPKTLKNQEPEITFDITPKITTNLVQNFEKQCKIPDKNNTIEALADFQVLRKFIGKSTPAAHFRSSILDSDLLVYIMINETDVYKVIPCDQKKSG